MWGVCDKQRVYEINYDPSRRQSNRTDKTSTGVYVRLIFIVKQPGQIFDVETDFLDVFRTVFNFSSDRIVAYY